MEQPPKINQRNFYRLLYPTAERPRLRTETRDYEVSEISEGGIKIQLAGACVIQKGDPLEGILQFRTGETISIEGVVLRSDEEKVVVTLSSGISLETMLAEQIRLRKKYPMLFEIENGGRG